MGLIFFSNYYSCLIIIMEQRYLKCRESRFAVTGLDFIYNFFEFIYHDANVYQQIYFGNLL